MKLLATTVLLAQGAATLAQRPLKPYLGIDELTKPQVVQDGTNRRAQLDVTRSFDQGRRVRLAYDVEHPDDAYLLKLDQVEGLDAVSCTAGDVQLTFSSTVCSVECGIAFWLFVFCKMCRWFDLFRF